MRKVFWEDPYQTQLSTSVVSVEGARVLLAAKKELKSNW